MTDRPEVESGRAGKMGATRKLRRWKDEMWGILSPTRLLARMDYVGPVPSNTASTVWHHIDMPLSDARSMYTTPSLC